MKTSTLQALHHTLNTVCFGQKLRPLRIIQKDLRGRPYMGLYSWNYSTLVRRRGKKFANKKRYGPGKKDSITIDRNQPEAVKMLILLHEMVHQFEHTIMKSKSELQHTPWFKRKLTQACAKLGWPPPPAWSVAN